MARGAVPFAIMAAATHGANAHADIVLTDPGNYQVSTYATIVNPTFRSPFGLALNSGANGMPRGIYATTGFQSEPESSVGRDVLLVSEPNTVSVFATGLESSDLPLFAPGNGFGNDLLVPDPFTGTISRIGPGGNISTFSTSTPSPTAMAATFRPGWTPGVYATSFSDHTVHQLNPDGTGSLFATLPDLPLTTLAFPETGNEAFGSSLFVANFAKPSVIEATLASIWRVGPTGLGEQFVTNNPLLGGMEGMAFAPAGVFGGDLYITTFGINGFEQPDDGMILRVTPSGDVSVFATGLDGGGIVFDREGIFGGGMFVADFQEFGEGHIYHIVPTPSSIAALLLLSIARRRGRGRC